MLTRRSVPQGFSLIELMVGIAILGLLLSAPESAESLSQYHAAIMAFAASFAISALVALGLPGQAAERARR